LNESSIYGKIASFFIRINNLTRTNYPETKMCISQVAHGIWGIDFNDFFIEHIRTKIIKVLQQSNDLFNEEDIESSMYITTFQSRFRYIAQLIIRGYQYYHHEPSSVLNSNHDLQNSLALSHQDVAIEMAYGMDTTKILLFWKSKLLT